MNERKKEKLTQLCCLSLVLSSSEKKQISLTSNGVTQVFLMLYPLASLTLGRGGDIAGDLYDDDSEFFPFFFGAVGERARIFTFTLFLALLRAERLFMAASATK